MSRYKHIFFDLDRTLWDMETNSHATLLELAEKHKITERGIYSVSDFIEKYKPINDQLWLDYSQNKVAKEILRYERFRRAFKLFDIEDEDLIVAFGNDYVSYGPLKNSLVPHTIAVLEYLFPKYELHIITNGFQEVQGVKMKNSNIDKYFKQVITSEMAGCLKPAQGIFSYALNKANATVENSIMIGDSLEADVVGARNSGIAQVYYNPDKKSHTETITYEINCLSDLKNIL